MVDGYVKRILYLDDGLRPRCCHPVTALQELKISIQSPGYKCGLLGNRCIRWFLVSIACKYNFDSTVWSFGRFPSCKCIPLRLGPCIDCHKESIVRVICAFRQKDIIRKRLLAHGYLLYVVSCGRRILSV